MIAVVVRIRLILFDGVSLSVGASREKAHAVHEQLGKSTKLHPRAHEGRRGHVIHEKGTVVREKNAFPSEVRARTGERKWLLGDNVRR